VGPRVIMEETETPRFYCNSKFSETFPNPITIERAIKTEYSSSCTVPVFYCLILIAGNLLAIFEKPRNIKYYTKILTVEDGRTDRGTGRHWEGKCYFQNFARAQIKISQIYTINTHRCYCHIGLLNFLETAVKIRGLTNYATGLMCIHYRFVSY
jgi:hypothetical protein